MRLLPVLLFCSLAVAQEELVAELLKLEAPPRDFEKDPVAKAFGKPDPPPDDAPLPDILDFWTGDMLREERQPSAAVRERLFAACKEDPERILLLAPILPATKEVRDLVASWLEKARGRPEDRRLDEIAEMFLEDEDRPDPRTDKWAFRKLAESDWKNAGPLARELIEGDDDELEVAALVALMEHGDPKAQGRLKAIVEEASYLKAERDDAFDALAAAPREGFDEWCLTLFDDDELDMMLAVRERAGHWIPILGRLVDDQRPRVRHRAIDYLLRFRHPARAEALRPLLPWLTNPDWAEKPENGRLWVVEGLDEVDLPECVPGLLKILAGEEKDRILVATFRAIARYGAKQAGPLLRWSDNPGRYRARELDLKEAKRLASFVKRHRIDELAPVPYLAHDGISYYYLHLTPERGWRVYLNNPDLVGDTHIYRALVGRFDRLTAEGEWESRYVVQDRVDGVEILATRNVFDVWANGDDIRVDRDGWQTLDGTEVEEPETHSDLVMAPGPSGSWEREIAGGGTLRWSADRGLRIRRGARGEWIHRGRCAWPLFSPDRKWLVMAIAVQGSWGPPNGLLRVDVERGKAFDVDLPLLETNRPLVWLEAHRRMLILRGGDVPPYGGVLLDPATGESTKVNGTLRPFTRGTNGPLQPTGRPFEYWAARRDEKGTSVVRFDTRKFEVTLQRRFPGIEFYTRQMHVDGDRLYLAYEGDLLRLPLPKR